MEVRQNTCGNCAFYHTEKAGTGECRRYAPQPNRSIYVTRTEATGTYKNDVHWPKVYDSNWCGEHHLKQ